MKLSALTIYIIGFSLAVMILSYGLFWQYLPNMTDAKYQKQHADDLFTEANKLKKAGERYNKAVRTIQVAEAAWKEVAATRTPPSSVAEGGISLAVNAWQLSVDTRRFRNNVQRLVNQQLKKGGVRVLNGPTVPGPSENEAAGGILASYYNFGQFPFPVVIYNLGTVTVQGKYKEILDNMRAWKSMPKFLAVTDGLRIDGTSPQLTATYNLTIVGFIRGKEIYPDVPEGASAGGGAGARGGMPGGMSGMMGGPRGMMPGGMGGGMPGGMGRPGMPGGMSGRPGMVGSAATGGSPAGKAGGD